MLLCVNFDNYKISDSLVFVESLNHNYGTRGMGFVYNVERDTSYIITNYHVIENSNECVGVKFSNECNNLLRTAVHDPHHPEQ